MARLPVLGASDVVRALEVLGWEVARLGNHIILVRDGSNASLSVPNHAEVARGTLRRLIRDAGVTVTEFTEALTS